MAAGAIDLIMTVTKSSARVETSREDTAFLHVEVFEDDTLLGEQLVGDIITLEEGSLRVNVVVRRASFHSVREEEAKKKVPLEGSRPPPELMALVLRSKRGGALSSRSHAVRIGDRIRLRAIVERAGDGMMIVRDDLGPCHLDEVLPIV